MAGEYNLTEKLKRLYGQAEQSGAVEQVDVKVTQPKKQPTKNKKEEK